MKARCIDQERMIDQERLRQHLKVAHAKPFSPDLEAARKSPNYSALLALVKGASSPLSALANIAATIYEAKDAINWAGFYALISKGASDAALSNDGTTRATDASSNATFFALGPFCGRPACDLIPSHRGVLGLALENTSLYMRDVHLFPAHIACDERSQAEIVVPFDTNQGTLLLDIDSEQKDFLTPELSIFIASCMAVIEDLFSSPEADASIFRLFK